MGDIGRNTKYEGRKIERERERERGREREGILLTGRTRAWAERAVQRRTRESVNERESSGRTGICAWANGTLMGRSLGTCGRDRMGRRAALHA
jgi:hypothetical protein